MSSASGGASVWSAVAPASSTLVFVLSGAPAASVRKPTRSDEAQAASIGRDAAARNGMRRRQAIGHLPRKFDPATCAWREGSPILAETLAEQGFHVGRAD